MISTRPPTSNSSRLFNNPFVTVPKAPITIGIIVTFMFHSFFSIPKKVPGIYPSFHILSVLFCGHWDSKVYNFASPLSFFFFSLIIIRSGLLAQMRWFVCMSKSHRSLCASFTGTDAGLCIYHLFIWSNFNFLHISQWITFPAPTSRIIIIIIIISCNLLHNSVNWWPFTGVWITASLLRSTSLFSEF